MSYEIPDGIRPSGLKWTIALRSGGQLYGVFDKFEDAESVALEEFGTAKGKWHLKSIWPVEVEKSWATQSRSM